jgi:S-adenosylmethionine hydrolase
MDQVPLIALLTDFGTRDGYVGIMRGVMLGIAPQARLVDLTHDIPAQNVRAAAWVLHTAWRYFPEGTVFLCVVDPGVGTARRAIALHAAARVFVGPDNGLFSYVLAEAVPTAAATLENPLYQLPLPSATFHGRDIFSPAAAYLARGLPVEALGAPVAPETLVRLPLPQPVWHGELLVGHVVHVDHFGNLITDLGPALAGAVLSAPAIRLTLGDFSVTARAATFAAGPEGEPFLLRDSSGHLAIAVRNGSAADYVGAGEGAAVEVYGLRPADVP